MSSVIKSGLISSRRVVIVVALVAALVGGGMVASTLTGAQAGGIGVSESVGDAIADEGNPGTPGTITFTVTAAGIFLTPDTVHYTTVNGTAKAGEDFVAKSGDLTFNGPSAQEVKITLIGDSTPEPDEGFMLQLSGASSNNDTGFATIRNDDVALTVADKTVAEGNTGTANAAIVITLSAPRSVATTVKYSTAEGAATSPEDFTAPPPNSTATIPANATSATVNVPIVGDTIDEANETFTFGLAEPSPGVTIQDDIAVVTITDDDAAPTASVTAANANEGADITFTVTLSAAAGRATKVRVGTGDHVATSPADFTAIPVNTEITIPAGATSAPVQVTTKTDDLDEPDETFYFGVAAQKDDGTYPSPTVVLGTIKDTNVVLGQISIADASKAEGNEGESNLVFTVTLSSASTEPVTVAYATGNGDTNSATAGTDYTAANGTVTFAPGDTSKTVTVVVKGDTEAEVNETFKVVLSSPTNATLLDATGIGTITNDDATPLSPESITTGAGPGAGAHVRQFDKNGAPLAPESFFPYPDGPGVRVARGDLDGDGHDELIVGPGPGLESIIRVFTSNGSAELAQIDAYPGFMGGVYVAAGDVDGDGKDEVITGAGAGGGPHVRTFALTGAAGNRQLTGSSGFMAADTSEGYSGGIFVTAGDLTGNGIDAIIVGLASNGPPVVAVWSYAPSTNTPTLRGFFLAYDQSFRGGVSVSAGDLDGDGKAEIVTGAGPGGGPHVRVFANNGAGLPGSAYAYDPNFRGGVNVAIGDVDGDGTNEIIAAAGPGGGPHVRAFDVLMNPLPTSFYAYAPTSGGGVFVAAGRP